MSKTAEKIVNRSALKSMLADWKAKGDSIVFTNGCFDLLHPGHVDLLERAAALGDHLIVALNTDQSVKRLKGSSRPFYQEKMRAKMLAALQLVDAVILFEEDTPEALVKLILPDILVKGGDYHISNIAGANHVLSNGGKVEALPLLEGFSTTQLIKQIKQTKG